MQLTMTKVMDHSTAEHFYRWLDKLIPEDQHCVEQHIHRLLRDNPGDYPGERGWTEVLDHANADYGHFHEQEY